MAAVFAALRSPVLLVFSLAAAPPHLQHILQNLAHRVSSARRRRPLAIENDNEGSINQSLTSRLSLSLSESLLRKATLAAAPWNHDINVKNQEISNLLSVRRLPANTPWLHCT